ncbi:P-loop NTPase family protein [Solitalea koreensis]|uniref:Uncharacterized protein n=1 Tax=Solitalea koreensis TaxID=543615 RepID=A0A521EEI2_9SPHI|nr:hypothetical protein [Solitalea koreensis]SMO82305.1 hypothetical protein SAMN06265350_1148 [Solitalea koreensis]
MNTQSTLELLWQLKLHGMAGCYQAVLEQPLHQQPEPHLLLGMLVEEELQQRQMARMDLYLLSTLIQIMLPCIARTAKLLPQKRTTKGTTHPTLRWPVHR